MSDIWKRISSLGFDEQGIAHLFRICENHGRIEKFEFEGSTLLLECSFDEDVEVEGIRSTQRGKYISAVVKTKSGKEDLTIGTSKDRAELQIKPANRVVVSKFGKPGFGVEVEFKPVKAKGFSYREGLSEVKLVLD